MKYTIEPRTQAESAGNSFKNWKCTEELTEVEAEGQTPLDAFQACVRKVTDKFGAASDPYVSKQTQEYVQIWVQRLRADMIAKNDEVEKRLVAIEHRIACMEGKGGV